jgi:integrase
MLFLSPEQVDALAGAVGDRYRVAIYTAAYGGLRAGELWALKVPRVNLLKRRLEVVESLSEVRGELVVGPTKTRNRRTVSLPSFLADMIGKHVGDYPSREGYIFSAAKGGPVRHHNFMLRHFYPAARGAGMPEGLRFHDLRHTCAAILTGQGWNPKQIQQRLGHASIRTTLDRYGHLFEGHDAELLTRLDDLAAESRG